MKMSIIKYINKIANIQSKNKNLTLARKFSIHPITDDESYRFFSQQENIHWSALELVYIDDKKFYDEASNEIKRLVDYIIAFFLPGDGVISNNIITRFMLECESYEEQAMFISQMHIELVHAETYALIAKTFKPTDEEILQLIEDTESKPSVAMKLDYMNKWMLADTSKWSRLLAAACAEGIFFCVLFAVIFWFRSKNLFKNFITANELISRDESLHRDFNLMLYKREVNKILNSLKGTNEYFIFKKQIEDESIDIIEDALRIEDAFCDELLSSPVEDLNKEDLKTYARVVVNNFLCEIDMEARYDVKNPFTWMNDINMEQKGNFYEVRIAAYKKTTLENAIDIDKRAGREKIENPFDGDVKFDELNDEEVDYDNL